MSGKMILRKSDLWSFTVTFGVITLFCLAYLALHLANGEYGEAFAMGIVTLIPLVLTIACGFTDRSAAMARETPEPPDHSRRWAARLSEELEARTWKESGLNPENSDRARDAMKKDPPPIG